MASRRIFSRELVQSNGSKEKVVALEAFRMKIELSVPSLFEFLFFYKLIRRKGSRRMKHCVIWRGGTESIVGWFLHEEMYLFNLIFFFLLFSFLLSFFFFFKILSTLSQ